MADIFHRLVVKSRFESEARRAYDHSLLDLWIPVHRRTRRLRAGAELVRRLRLRVATAGFRLQIGAVQQLPEVKRPTKNGA